MSSDFTLECTYDGATMTAKTIENGLGAIDSEETRWEYSSPSAAVAAWLEWDQQRDNDPVGWARKYTIE